MSTIPTSRIYKGWLKELFWFLLVLLQSPVALFYRESFIKARTGAAPRKQTVIVLTDALCSPLIYRRLAGRLSREGFSVLILSSASIFSGLRTHASRLSEALNERDIQAGILIGHGMGSLIALNLPDAARQRIQHLISLGTPFHGTRLLMPLRFIPALRDMAVGSEYLLLNRMNALLFPSFDPFSAFQDQWILPFNLTHFGQGRDLILDQVGHYNIAVGGENLGTITEIVTERYPAPATAVAAAHLQLDRPGANLSDVAAKDRTASPVAAARKPLAKATTAKAPVKSSKKTAKKATKKPATKAGGKAAKKKKARAARRRK
ncbi:MAG: alpha/beta hydrolase [bacterium]|nr:alpha/beta hydrolase [bacterium]